MKYYHHTKKGGGRIEPVHLKEQILTEFRESGDHELSLFADSFFSTLYPPAVWDSDQELYVINDDLVSLEAHTLYGVEELNRRIREEMENTNYGYETPTEGGKRKTKRKKE